MTDSTRVAEDVSLAKFPPSIFVSLEAFKHLSVLVAYEIIAPCEVFHLLDCTYISIINKKVYSPV